MMTNFIEEGGWGMYPVLIFGLAAFAAALWHVMSPRRERVPLVGWLMGLTMVAGMLGTATGVQASARYIGEVAADERWIFLIGLKESLNNLTLALILIALTMMAMVLSHLRGEGRRASSEARVAEAKAPEEPALLRAV